MALLEIKVEQILELIQQLPLASKQSIFEVLRQDITEASSASDSTLDEESKTWLEADMIDELPEYDWGPAGMPDGLPVTYIPGQGIFILEADIVES
ncbi:MAG: hypothetical protein AAGC54_09450 [Cyanobacteria bacterium P01_F01_bin.4]